MEIPHEIYALIACYHCDLVLTDLLEVLLWKYRYHKNIVFIECFRACCLEQQGRWDLPFIFAVLKFLKINPEF